MALICFAPIQPWCACTTTVGVEQSAVVLVLVKPTSRDDTDKFMPLVLAAHKIMKRSGCSNGSKADDSIYLSLLAERLKSC
jgi:hypothetical protein